VSFVGAADGRVLLATFTGEPLVDPGREVGLLHLPRPIDLAKTPGGVLISRGNVAPKPKPANPQVSRSQTWDWGYVYDHNGDGRIDHLVFLIGAMFIEPENAPINLPSLLGPNNIVDRQTASFVLDNLQAGFWQLLDVDHDGAIDTLAYPAMQNANGWFRGWAVLTDPGAAPARRTCRIMDRDGRVIEGCTAVAGGAGGIDDGHGGYDGSTASAHEHAQRPDLVWEALQQGANACRLKAGNFRP
jgi:hypothetical protein